MLFIRRRVACSAWRRRIISLLPLLRAGGGVSLLHTRLLILSFRIGRRRRRLFFILLFVLFFFPLRSTRQIGQRDHSGVDRRYLPVDTVWFRNGKSFDINGFHLSKAQVDKFASALSGHAADDGALPGTGRSPDHNGRKTVIGSALALLKQKGEQFLQISGTDTVAAVKFHKKFSFDRFYC